MFDLPSLLWAIELMINRFVLELTGWRRSMWSKLWNSHCWVSTLSWRCSSTSKKEGWGIRGFLFYKSWSCRSGNHWPWPMFRNILVFVLQPFWKCLAGRQSSDKFVWKSWFHLDGPDSKYEGHCMMRSVQSKAITHFLAGDRLEQSGKELVLQMINCMVLNVYGSSCKTL